MNKMHDSVSTEKCGGSPLKKSRQDGLAVLQMDSADSLTMFDRLPMGTQRIQDERTASGPPEGPADKSATALTQQAQTSNMLTMNREKAAIVNIQ